MGPRFKILTPASDNGSVLDQLAAGNEQTVLSYYLNEPDAFTKLPVSPDDFGLPVNRMIFGAILDVYDNGEPLNNLSVSKRLREKGELEKVGADSAIVSILNSPSSFPTAEYALELMRDASAKREALKIVGRFQKGESELEEMIDQLLKAKTPRDSTPLIEFRSPMQLKNFVPPPGLRLVGDYNITGSSVFVIAGAARRRQITGGG